LSSRRPGRSESLPPLLDEWLRNEPLIEPGHVFKLEDINDAFDLLQHQRSHGKVVLVP
jgi:threonine dehydrogenase-like Zn-dependent dehydrogenase